jgi:hypothetical protein
VSEKEQVWRDLIAQQKSLIDEYGRVKEMVAMAVAAGNAKRAVEMERERIKVLIEIERIAFQLGRDAAPRQLEWIVSALDNLVRGIEERKP